MASENKSQLPRKKPNMTRNGKPRIYAYSLEKLNQELEKAQRPRDKNKINNRIKVLNSRA
jgi:hypothetical protein